MPAARAAGNRFRPTALALAFAVLLAACGPAATTSPSPTAGPGTSPPSGSATASATPAADGGAVVPAPGSDSAVYEPNPSEIVVAIEAGHGGCLDWGVPDPQERGPDYSEKAITLAIARELGARLEAEGVRAVLVRDDDVALAGDLYPQLGCEGEPFRDVNGDGLSGFGPDLPEATRTRDELQARLDLANLLGADVLLSLHVDSITDAAGTPLPIARTETFYTDETSWGVSATEPLAAAIQRSLVTSMAAVADYERQDRGTNAHNLYIVAPPLFETTPDRDDPRRQPTRGALMPAVLVEVGSITRPEEHALLLTDEGVAAAAEGILGGLVAWFGERELAARLSIADVAPGAAPEAVDGDGPPFVAPVMDGGVLPLTVTNTGMAPWPAGGRVLVGWQPSDAPYLYLAPDAVEAIDVTLPALGPGASVRLTVDLPPPPADRALAWISLEIGGEVLADHGSPALQLSSQSP